MIFLLQTFVFAHSSSSSNYTILTSTIDSGNGVSSSTNYTVRQSSVGGMVGSFSSTSYAGGSGQVEAAAPFIVDLRVYASWAYQYFSLTQPNTGLADDFDLDGVSNGEEFIALTDPTDINSFLSFEITAINNLANTTQFTVSPFTTDTSLRTYRLLSQDDSLNGTFLPTGFGLNGAGTITDTRTIITTRFYQLEISIPGL